MSEMQSLFIVGGIGVLSHAIETIMTNTGQGDKVTFLKITTYCACAFVAWDAWWRLVRYIEMMFGVKI